MVIDINKTYLYGLDKNRLVIYVYVEKWKPWYKRFNMIFAKGKNYIEIGIFEGGEGKQS